MQLRRVAIVRESTAGAAAEGEAEDDAPATPGTGLYDPPPGDKAKYCSLYCDGGLTLVCPYALPLEGLEAKGCISLDWTGVQMRYQADRKFTQLDGSLNTFELTEIQSKDAPNYPPDFGGLQR